MYTDSEYMSQLSSVISKNVPQLQIVPIRAVPITRFTCQNPIHAQYLFCKYLSSPYKNSQNIVI